LVKYVTELLLDGVDHVAEFGPAWVGWAETAWDGAVVEGENDFLGEVF